MSTAEKILVVGPAWVGDMVMAQSLFRRLIEQQPDRCIDVLAPRWTAPLLERMPEVRRALELPLGHGQFGWGARRALGKALAAEGYQRAFVLPNSWKSALVPWFADIPRRTGWRGEMRYGLLNDCRPLDKARYPLMVERFCALAEPPLAPLGELPRPRLVIDAEGRDALLARLQLDTRRPILALAPGAEFGPSKRYPTQHFAAVAEHWLARGYQIWLFGSPNDREAAESIVQLIRPDQQAQIVDLTGRTQLGEALDLLSLAAAVVANDSGLMHIACALERPTVVVYGSTSPGFTPPLAPPERVRVLQESVDCGPCFERVCPRGDLRCLQQLLPNRVNQALQELLGAAH